MTDLGKKIPLRCKLFEFGSGVISNQTSQSDDYYRSLHTWGQDVYSGNP